MQRATSSGRHTKDQYPRRDSGTPPPPLPWEKPWGLGAGGQEAQKARLELYLPCILHRWNSEGQLQGHLLQCPELGPLTLSVMLLGPAPLLTLTLPIVVTLQDCRALPSLMWAPDARLPQRRISSFLTRLSCPHCLLQLIFPVLSLITSMLPKVPTAATPWAGSILADQCFLYLPPPCIPEQSRQECPLPPASCC